MSVKIVNKLRLGQKMTASILAMNVISMAAVLVIVFLRTSAMQTDSAMENVRNLAGLYSKDIQAQIEVPMDAARTMAQIMEGFEGIQPGERREYYSDLLRNVLAANPELLGVWTCWEANELDGLDAKYAGTVESDTTGRFIPYWNRGSGSIKLEPLVDYEKTEIGRASCRERV